MKAEVIKEAKRITAAKKAAKKILAKNKSAHSKVKTKVIHLTTRGNKTMIKEKVTMLKANGRRVVT